VVESDPLCEVGEYHAALSWNSSPGPAIGT
jgi:hypothetical protein